MNESPLEASKERQLQVLPNPPLDPNLALMMQTAADLVKSVQQTQASIAAAAALEAKEQRDFMERLAKSGLKLVWASVASFILFVFVCLWMGQEEFLYKIIQLLIAGIAGGAGIHWLSALRRKP